MNACDRERVWHDLLGELDGPERRSVGEHLRVCPSCREEREEWNEWIGLFQNLPSAKASARLVARIQDRIAKEGSRSRARKLLLRSAAAGLAASLALFLYFESPFPSRVVSFDRDPLSGLRSIQSENGSWAGGVGPTALATLAFLEKGSGQKTGPDRLRIEEAIHFLTREKEASPIEELLRCEALLKETEAARAVSTPQLQLALQNAVRKTSGMEDPVAAGLLREVIERARRLRLDTAEGERILGRLVLGIGEQMLGKPDWKGISERLAERKGFSPAQDPIRLASACLLARS